jgi:hypothetical protein
MRKLKWLAAAVLVVSTTGCVENQGYGYNSGYGSNGGYAYNGGYNNGYSSGYYPSSSGYYSQPARVNNYYYNPQPTVVTQTRYVPVPTPVPVPSRHRDRSIDHRSGDRDNDYRHQAPRADRPHSPPPQANNNNSTRTPGMTGGNRHDGGNNRDRDGDGKPDRRG